MFCYIYFKKKNKKTNSQVYEEDLFKEIKNITLSEHQMCDLNFLFLPLSFITECFPPIILPGVIPNLSQMA